MLDAEQIEIRHLQNLINSGKVAVPLGNVILTMTTAIIAIYGQEGFGKVLAQMKSQLEH